MGKSIVPPAGGPPVTVPRSVVTPAGTTNEYHTSLLFTPEHGNVETPEGVAPRLLQVIGTQGPVAVTVIGVGLQGSSEHCAKPWLENEKVARAMSDA